MEKVKENSREKVEQLIPTKKSDNMSDALEKDAMDI